MSARMVIGEKRWKLTLLEELPKEKGSKLKGRFLCECGNITTTRIDRASSGITKSCSCLRSELAINNMTKHGMRRTAVYSTWCAMIARCSNPKSHTFKDYGGRGISVCERWHSFVLFYEDMGDRPPGMTIDRIDNDRGYSPDNCRWSTPSEQVQNQRKRKGCTSRFRGVNITNSGSWQARITIDGKRINLGHFDTEEAAYLAYEKAQGGTDTRRTGDE